MSHFPSLLVSMHLRIRELALRPPVQDKAAEKDLPEVSEERGYYLAWTGHLQGWTISIFFKKGEGLWRRKNVQINEGNRGKTAYKEQIRMQLWRTAAEVQKGTDIDQHCHGLHLQPEEVRQILQDKTSPSWLLSWVVMIDWWSISKPLHSLFLY